MHNGSQIHPLYVLCSMYGQKFLNFKSTEAPRKKKKCSLRGDALRITHDWLTDSSKTLYP